MDGPKSQTIEIEADEPRSITQAVETLYAGATEALTRAANCDDPDWQKFHLGIAAAYSEWARQMEPLVGVKARIDEEAAMISRRFNLGAPLRGGAVQKTDAGEPEYLVTAPETIAALSDLSPPLAPGHDHDVLDGQEPFTEPPTLPDTHPARIGVTFQVANHPAQ